MKNRKQIWVYCPSIALKGSVAKERKKMIDKEAQILIDTILKPKCIKIPKGIPRCNYIVDIYTRWHQSYLYFISKYYCPFENRLSEYFEAKEARLQALTNGSFILSYMRHTGQWWPIRHNVTLKEALREIGESSLFFPAT